MPRHSVAPLIVLLGALVLIAGCQDSKDDYKPVAENQPPVEEDHHTEHGPHDGHIIDLGDHDYLAEIVMDPQRTVTIYLLEHDDQQPLPVDPQNVTLHLMVDEKPVAVELQPKPQEKDPEGKASAFVVPAEKLPEAVRSEEDLEGRLVVKIDGKSFTGELEHHGHDH